MAQSRRLQCLGLREDAEYMLTTFSNVGRRQETTLDGDTSPWLPSGTAGLVLNAYDALGPLTS